MPRSVSQTFSISSDTRSDQPYLLATSRVVLRPDLLPDHPPQLTHQLNKPDQHLPLPTQHNMHLYKLKLAHVHLEC